MVLLRKSVPQNHNLKTAAELGVTWAKPFCARAILLVRKSKNQRSGIFVVLDIQARKLSATIVNVRKYFLCLR
jgi:hypothetical protein